MNQGGEYQADFFIDSRRIEKPRKKIFFRKNFIKKSRFNITLTYELISLLSICLVIIASFFFYLGTLAKKGTKEKQESVKKEAVVSKISKNTPVSHPDALEIRPPAPDKTVEQASEPNPAESAQKASPEKEKNANVALPEPKVPRPGYALQVATFVKEERFLKEMKDLKNAGFDVFDQKSGKYHQICIGPYAKDKILKIKEELKDKYKDAFLRKLKNKNGGER